jgi:hypothetical protein
MHGVRRTVSRYAAVMRWTVIRGARPASFNSQGAASREQVEWSRRLKLACQAACGIQPGREACRTCYARRGCAARVRREGKLIACEKEKRSGVSRETLRPDGAATIFVLGLFGIIKG